jgi:hypothetical protein
MGRMTRRIYEKTSTLGGLIALIAAVAATWATDLQAPPRFDGAGYAVLAESLATGHGYREIDHPGAPRHAHFPPGYPISLALLWRVTGRSSVAAHLLALTCTTVATVAAWCWFRRIYSRRVAACLGVALALNWTWNRNGGAIQSEPLFLLLGQLAVLGAIETGRQGRMRSGVVLGGMLAACVLTRHVGAALSVAVVLDLLLRRRAAAAVAAGLTCTLLLTPWAAWLLSVRENTQAGLLASGGLVERVMTLAVFYVQRLPDLVTGPFVEIATVFRHSGPLAMVANAWAVLATVLIVSGWGATLKSPRRRLAGLVACCTLALLLVWPFTEAGRFLIPLLPCVLIGATEGLAVLARWAGLRRPRACAAWLVLAASLPYSLYALATDRAEAQRRTHAEFDAACHWILREGRHTGPVLTRHPGEVHWQTGRQALAPVSGDPAEIDRLIGRYGVAYLLVDHERYANAPPSPLAAFVGQHPGRVRAVWTRATGPSSVAVYEVVPTGATGGVQFFVSNVSRPKSS